MYMTCSQASPCLKMESPRPYCTVVFVTPAESRNACALNAGVLNAGTFATPLEDRLGSMGQAWHAAGPCRCAQQHRRPLWSGVTIAHGRNQAPGGKRFTHAAHTTRTTRTHLVRR